MRRDPDDPFDDLFREIERLMSDVMGEAGTVDVDPGSDTHVDVHEYDDRITVIADMPGVEKSDIDVTCDGRTLSIRASGASASYAERVRLPAPVDEQSASATYNNGVLEVQLERADDSADIDVS
jgi:HSP20 family protein